MDDDRDVVLGHHDRAGTPAERRGAGLYDVLVLGWAVGVVAVPVREAAPALADGAFLALWLVQVVVEGLSGASPGKHVTGLRVRRLDGGRTTLLTAARRRPWGWLLPLQFVGPLPNAIATAVALGTLLVMLVSVERAPDGRGFHDRLAGTVVEGGHFDRRARLAVVATTLAAAVLGIVLAAQLAPVPAAAALASTEDPPACVPGGGTIVLDGTVAPEEARTYRYLPFEVAPGTTRVEVAYDWGDQDPLLAQEPQNQTVVDLGLWDADGLRGAQAFRGWGGSRQGVISRDMPPVWVQADSADRGFTPGAVEPGTWHVELGFGNVNRGGGTWHVEITCLEPEVGPEPPYEPVDEAHVADPEPGWFHGDFHMHGRHSHPDGPTHEEVVAHARDVGLDVIVLSEYVTTVHQGTWGPVAAANPDLLVVPSREVITYSGHANVLGETPDVVDYRHGWQDVTLGDVQDRSIDAGALFQVNHPTIFPDPVFTSFCRGCEFNLEGAIDLDRVTTVEVLTGPIEVGPDYVGGPPGPGIENPFVATAIDFYEELLLAGHFVAPVSGSDAKHVDGHGSSATAVYAEELSRPALFDALRAGRSYVRTRGVADSPAIEVTATADGETVMLGGTLAADRATMTIHVTGGAGQLAEVTRNGEPFLTLPIASDDETLTVPIVRTPDEGPLGTFHRVDVREPSGIRSVLSGAVFLAEPQPDDGNRGGRADGDGDRGRDSAPAPTTGRDEPAGPTDGQGGLAATGGGAATLGAVAAIVGWRLRRRPT